MSVRPYDIAYTTPPPPNQVPAAPRLSTNAPARTDAFPPFGAQFSAPPPVSPMTAINNTMYLPPDRRAPEGQARSHDLYPPILEQRRGAVDLTAILDQWHNCLPQKLLPHIPPLSRFTTVGAQTVVFKPELLLSFKGVSMLELLRNPPGALLTNAQDRVLQGAGTHTIHLRVVWPGYESCLETISVYNQEQGHITRLQLGVAVAHMYAGFIQSHAMETVPGRYEGWQWRLGPKGLGIDNMRLAQLVNTSGNIWQADINIVLGTGETV